MSSGCGDVLSLEDLKIAKMHQLFEAEVITGKAGGVATGADIDYAVNAMTGQTQKTLPAVLRDAGFTPASFTFTTGGPLGINDADKAVLWPLASGGDGNYYAWKGVLPKLIPASSSPASTGGVSASGWVAVSEAALRSDLSADSGASLVGEASGGSVQDAFNNLSSGFYALGYRSYTIKDRLDESLSVKAFGAKGDGVTDDTAAIQACVDFSATTNKRVYFPKGKYNISATINIPVGMHISGSASQATDLASVIACKNPNMVAMWFRGTENIVTDLTVFGFETNGADLINGYGQDCTCTGFRFQLDSGAKDLDSRVKNCAFVFLSTGIYGIGANLNVRDSSFTSIAIGIDLYPAATDPENFRGMIIEGCRWHKCGGNTISLTFPAMANSSCIRVGDKLRASKISNCYADLGIHRFFAGSFGRGCLMNDIELYQLDGDAITINNTSFMGSYDSFVVSGISLNNQTGVNTAASGYAAILTGCTSGLVTDISGTFIRKGGVRLINSPDNLISNVNLRNINVAFSADGVVFSGLEVDATSTNNKCYNLMVRNTLDAAQARSVVHVETGGVVELDNITGVNCAAQTSGGGTLTGNINTAAVKPTVGVGSAPPTTGTWRRNDIVYNNAAAGGVAFAWICVTAGTPGVWRAVATIASS